MSDEETVLNLFDTYWFKQRVFVFTQSKPRPVSQKSESEKPNLNRVTTLMKKSHSDQFLSSPEPNSPSPKSVLGPHLQTILSGKEVHTFDDSPPNDIPVDTKPRFTRKPDRNIEERRRKREKSSKSLSELEFEELKGFMDLGFVFSDEDKDSRLVSIIPGLQRFGKKIEDSSDVISVSRPYLSEAWGEKKREKDPMMDWSWRIPDFGNEMELKDHIRFWAHSVASTVII